MAAPNNTTTAVQQQQKSATPIDALKRIMNADSVKEQFNNVMKENSGAFMASIIDLYNGDTYLQKCDPKAVVMEALKAATLKLAINKQLGFAYIVPYAKGGNTVIPTFQIGYKGYIQLAMRTAQYRYVNADIIYEGMSVKHDYLTGAITIDGAPTSEKAIGYFAYIELLNGYSKTVYMSAADALAWGKRYSKSFGKDTSPWKTNFNEMALKTCMRRLLSKYGIMSIEMAAAYESDSQDEGDNNNASPADNGANSNTVIDLPPENFTTVADEPSADVPSEQGAEQTTAAGADSATPPRADW